MAVLRSLSDRPECAGADLPRRNADVRNGKRWRRSRGRVADDNGNDQRLIATIADASQRSQLIVVTHSTKLVELLRATGGAVCELVKEVGETVVRDLLPQAWVWPSR